jgi:two-component system sensor histidine kinase DegS
MTPRTATLQPMDGPLGEPTSTRFDELHAEAAEALSYSANTLRAVRDRYRTAYFEALGRWQQLSDDLAAFEREPAGGMTTDGADGNGSGGPAGATSEDGMAVAAAEAGATDLRLRLVRGEVDRLRNELGRHEAELSRVELAIKHLETTWLFLERGDGSLITGSLISGGTPGTSTEVQMRIVEAQEAERARLAQEIHDGPAQALSNAIFQVDFIERVLDTDLPLARTELRFLRELLRRELGDVRGFIGQLRPPVLEELGLDGSIRDAVSTQAAIAGRHIATTLQAPSEALTESSQTVVLRVVQEALQNIRKHAGATDVVVATMLDDGQWVLEVRDDGRGFDVGAVAARGRRNFGLQFMRERAELIGGTFEVRSRPGAGTVVRLAIPITRKESG